MLVVQGVVEHIPNEPTKLRGGIDSATKVGWLDHAILIWRLFANLWPLKDRRVNSGLFEGVLVILMEKHLGWAVAVSRTISAVHITWTFTCRKF